MGVVEGDEARERLTAAGLAYVCAHLDELQDLLTQTLPDPAPIGEAPVLARLQHALTARPVGAGSDPIQEPDLYGLLDELHDALQQAGDRAGVWGNVDPGQRGGPWM
uniref:hypothetical protein n=1 Tax=Streptomyces chryseus TaxID=68186 RepID=UPI001ABF375F